MAALDTTCRELGVPIVRGGAMQQPIGLVNDLTIYRRVTKAFAASEAAKAAEQPAPVWAQRVLVEIEMALREQQALAEMRAMGLR